MTTYTVQVHVIQALNLIPGEKNFCIPLPVVECFGEKQVEKVVAEKTCSPFWDKMYCFEKTGIADLRTEKVVVSVVDTNTWFQNALIGQFSFELASIYDQPDHELYRRWCVLTNPDDEATGLTPKGWLRVSILCKKDSDPFPVHEDGDVFADEATDNAESLQDSILKPPTLNTSGYFLHLYINRAKELIKMDTFGATDAFIGATFAGGKMVRTKTVDNTLNPTFEEFLVIPVPQPSVSDVLELSVWDEDRTFGIGRDELISTHILSVKDIVAAGGMGPTWISFYCHPPTGNDGDDLESTMKLFRSERRNEPERAYYCGAVLVEAFLEPTDKVIGGAPAMKPQPIRQEPPMTQYCLRFIAHQVAEIKLGFLESVRVMVRWGTERRITDVMQKDEKTGQFCFFEQLSDIVLTLPEDVNQLPAVVVTIRRGMVGEGERVAYKKLWPFDDIGEIRADVDDETGAFAPRWHLLERDWRQTGDGDAIPPYLQFQLGVSRLDDPLVPPPGPHPVKPPTSHWMLRAHIFLARDLIAADPTGSSDPYVEVRCGSAAAVTTHRDATLSPLWFESIECTALLPSDPLGDLSSAPLIQLLVYDRDEGVLPDDMIGRGEVTISADMFVSGVVGDYSETIPTPTWIPLYSSVKGASISAAAAAQAGVVDDDGGSDEAGDDPAANFSRAGKILACFQVIHPTLARSPQVKIGSPYWSLVPEYKPKRCLEVEVVSLRGLMPPPTMSRPPRVVNPYITVRVDDASTFAHVVRGRACNEPSSSAPNVNEVLRLPISEPLDPLFMPTILIELQHEPDGSRNPPQLIGRLEIPLEKVLAGAGHDLEGDGVGVDDPEAAVRAVLEQVGLGGGEIDGEGEIFEDENAPEWDLGPPADSDAEGNEDAAVVALNANGEPEHTPAEELPKELEACVSDLPYKRYRLLRGCAPVFDSFLGVFSTASTAPRVAGVLKGSVHVVDIDDATDAAAQDEVGPVPDILSGASHSDVVTWYAKLKAAQRRILNSEAAAAESSAALKAFYAPREYVLRVYCVRGYYLVPPKGVGNKCNPHLVLKAPLSDEEWYPRHDSPDPTSASAAGPTGVGAVWPAVHATLSPAWRHTFSDIGPISLPGSQPLVLEVWDRQRNTLLSDDWTLIGGTKIEVDDRVFSKWAMDFSYYSVPTETRTLYAPTSRAPQGLVEVIVQVLTPEQARAMPPMNIKGPGPEDYELHAIIWGCRKVAFPPGKVVAKEDTVGCLCCAAETINIRTTLDAKWDYPEGTNERPTVRTDVHYASDDGTAAFNWRGVMPVTLPCRVHFLQLNVYDESSIPGCDPVAIAEATFNLRAFFDKAHKNPTKPLTICRDKPAKGGAGVKGAVGGIGAKVDGVLSKRSLNRRNRLRGEWVSVSHPKAEGGEPTAQVRLSLILYPRRTLASTDVPACGEDGWAELGKPTRPPGSFNPFNPFGWVQYAIYKYKYKAMCACCCLLCVVVFLLLVYVYLQLAPLLGMVSAF